MSLVGKKVQHAKYGASIIESEDASYIEARFAEGIKKFPFSALGKFITLTDPTAKAEAAQITERIQSEGKKKA